jgi:predicted GIY-YIG superfamily endonuclease
MKSFEVGEDKTLAIKTEKKIKSKKSRKFIESLLSINGDEIFKRLKESI